MLTTINIQAMNLLRFIGCKSNEIFQKNETYGTQNAMTDRLIALQFFTDPESI